MQKFKGRLLYMGWFNLPWKLVMNDGAIDLWPVIDKFFVSFNGKYAMHFDGLDNYTLAADKKSKFRFEYVANTSILLKEPEGFGFSNVYAYLDQVLTHLSGRLIEIEIENRKQIRFMADKDEEVYGVYFVGNGNSCEVPNGTEHTICKIGQGDCCIFLSIRADDFFCEKFNGPIAHIQLDRLFKSISVASRIGNCAILGRK